MSNDSQDNQKTSNSPPSATSVAQPAPAQPVSTGMAKEVEVPVPTDISLQDAREFEVPKEVAAHVQVQKQIPDIPPDLKQIGVTHAPADQHISDTKSAAKKIPLTDDQLNDGLTKPPTDSFRWLAEWCLKQLKLMHVHITKVNGRFIRVTGKA
ncbi:hypothetical protein HY469_05865 [Candidatus Roizmanbacteria bacterium]|nr:hypothetical protein [Candidatus Roizmanbacteria bacterium]